jgi:DNA-binding LacI/PurR family transcriptional regulator
MGRPNPPEAAGDGAHRARLADIATRARVSEATVSRVLNGRTGVAGPTRQAVLTALDVLGYERPAQLRERSTRLIGLIVPEFGDPIFPVFVGVLQAALAHHRYTTALCIQDPDGVHEDEYSRQLLQAGASGIIVVSGTHADATAGPDGYLALRSRGLPFVLVNGYLDGVDVPFVSADDAAAVDLAVGHLAALGHTRIGLAVGPARYIPVRRKVAGFGEALRRHLGVTELLPRIEYSLFSVEGGTAAAERLLDAGCTGLVCGSDLMALGAIRAARGRGLAVPGDVSVVGYDDSPLIGFTDPPLTTLRQPVVAMGAAAVRSLLDEIAGVRTGPTEFLFRPELVVRSSTGPAPRQLNSGS